MIDIVQVLYDETNRQATAVPCCSVCMCTKCYFLYQLLNGVTEKRVVLVTVNMLNVLQGALEYVRLTASTAALQIQCPHAIVGQHCILIVLSRRIALLRARWRFEDLN